MNCLIFVSLVWIVLSSHLQTVFGDVFEECDGLDDGTFVPGTQGCKSYIYCEGEDSYEGFCPSELLFNENDGSCAPANEVDCTDEDVTPEATSEVEPTTTTTTTEAPATAVVPDSTIKEQTPPPEQIVTTDNQATPTSLIKTTAPVNGGDVSTSSRPVQICPSSDDPREVIFLPSEVSCSEYYICYHGTPVRMFCSGELFFDSVTSKCELPIRVNCKVGVLTTPNPKKECVANTFDYFPYPKNCNYFYKCMNGFLSLQQCPVGFGWSEEMKLCLKLDHGRCPTRGAGQFQNQPWLNSIYS